MRSLPLLLVLLSSTTVMRGDAVAGKTHILIEGRQPYWVPISGGARIPLETSWTQPVAVATDGEHFLVASGADDYRVIAAMYDEGAREPFQVLTLESESGGHASAALWDGTRYVVFWAGPRNEARGATITRGGVVTRFEVPGFHIPRVIASDGVQVLLFNERLETESSARTIVLHAALLGPDLTLQKTFTLDSTPAGPQYAHDRPHFRTIAAIPFGSGFYAVASRGDGRGDNRMIGMRLSPEGTVLDRTVLDPSSSSVFDVDLVPSGAYLMVIFKRVGVRPVTATFVAANGSTIGPQEISPPIPIEAFPDPSPSAVRLQNGSLVLVRAESGAGVLTPLRDAPLLPRRRAARH